MKVLLTGATGLLGNNVLRILLDHGHQVAGLVRKKTSGKSLAGLSFQRIEADLAKPDEIETRVGNFDVLIHAAAKIHLGWTKLDESRQVNVYATQALAELCRGRGVRMIHVSTVDTLAVSVDGKPVSENVREPGNPPCSYVVTKREAEDVIQKQVAAGLDGVIVQPGFMVGPYDWKPSSGKMMLQIAKGRGLLAPGGGASVVDVRDVARGVLAAIEQGRSGESYILAGENITYFDLWSRMAHVIGVNPPRRPLPDWLATAAGKIGDTLSWPLGGEPLINSAATAMGQLRHYYSSAKAQAELGYQINSVEQALHDAWEWFIQVGMAPHD
jgi:dihydroflavonol-4-reductase